MGDPLVTVAMPLYNAARHLEETLGLIRAQTYRNLDIILLDNASEDATPEICARAAREDPRVRHVRHPRNIGAVANFNAGRELKRGEFFMWSAHDDEKLPEFVAECVAALQRNPAAVMACTWTVIITRDGERVHHPYSPAISSSRLDERLAAFVADTQCVAFYGLYRSSAVDAVGAMDPWLDGDRRYLFRAAIRGPFEVVPRPLFRFRLLRGADDYVASGYPLRPGAADYDLDLYRYFPRLLREAGVRGEELARAERAIRGTLRTYFDNRAAFLISRVLAGQPRPVRSLLGYARQYPPLLTNRMWWGAMRRVVLS